MWLAERLVAGCLWLHSPSFPSHYMFGSWGVGVVLYVGSHVQSFYRQVVTSWGVAGLWRCSSGHLPSTCWVSIRGLPSLAFGYVQFCSCASSCSELMLVNLCSWRSPVSHRGWDPSLFVVVSVFLGGRRNFLHAHQCTCQCHHSFMPAGSCQALLLGHHSGVGIPGHFLGVLVHRDQGMLSAYIGRPVPPWVFDCLPARGSLVLAVTFAFLGGSANCWHTRQTMHLYQRSWVLAGFLFCEARPPGHLSGVCGPLPLFFSSFRQ